MRYVQILLSCAHLILSWLVVGIVQEKHAGYIVLQ